MSAANGIRSLSTGSLHRFRGAVRLATFPPHRLECAAGGVGLTKTGSGTLELGGSAANTIAALASLGLTCGFVGKVRDDQLGKIFKHDLKGIGVEFATPAASDGPSTARCLIHVTPDAQRTMATFLGACVTLAPEDRIPFFEGVE